MQGIFSLWEEGLLYLGILYTSYTLVQIMENMLDGYMWLVFNSGRGRLILKRKVNWKLSSRESKRQVNKGDEIIRWLIEVVIVIFVEKNRLGFVATHRADFEDQVCDAHWIFNAVAVNQNKVGVRHHVFLRQRSAEARAGT